MFNVSACGAAPQSDGPRCGKSRAGPHGAGAAVRAPRTYGRASDGSYFAKLATGAMLDSHEGILPPTLQVRKQFARTGLGLDIAIVASAPCD